MRPFLTGIDLKMNQLANFIVQLLGVAPGSPLEGQMYHNTATHIPQIHNGTAFQNFLLENRINAAGGIAGLGGDGKLATALLPDSIVGQLEYQGVHDASGGAAPAGPLKGYYWIVSVGGTINAVTYAVGDWMVYNGATFDKIDNTDAVSSVAGRTGAIVLSTSDVADSTDKRYVTDAQRTVIGNTSGINTGDYVHPTADGSLHVPATSTTNNGKVLTAGATAGSFSWQPPAATGTQKFSGTIGNGVLVSMPVAHNLNSRNVIVGVYETASPYAEVMCDIEHTDVNTITVKTAVAPTAGQYTVVVIG